MSEDRKSLFSPRPYVRWRRLLCFLLVIEALTYGHPFFMVAAVCFFFVWLGLAYAEAWAWNHLNGGSPWSK